MEYCREVQDKQRMHIAKAIDKEVFNDVTFVIGPGKREFKMNRIFLAMISEPFEKMLFSQFKEGEFNAVIQIEDIDAEAFQSVVNYAYCKNPNIDTSNVFAVKHICRKYQISELSKLCDAYFAKAINEQTVCLLLNNAVINQMDEYIAICRLRIRKVLGSRNQAREIIKSNGFMRMNMVSIQQFLQFDELNVDEEFLWEGVLKWIDNNCSADLDAHPLKKSKLNNASIEKSTKEQKAKLLQKLYPFIRFGLMKGPYFVKSIQKKNFLSNEQTLAITNYILCRDEADCGVDCGMFCIKKRGIGQTITILRGTIIKKDWKYMGNTRDAICIEADQRVELEAVGIFNCNGQMSVRCKIYKGDNNEGSNCSVFRCDVFRCIYIHLNMYWGVYVPYLGNYSCLNMYLGVYIHPNMYLGRYICKIYT